MAEKQFLRLSEKWALAYDRLQWIIQYRGSAKGKPEKWRGVSFISSNRDILVLTLREKGIVSDPGKMEEVLALPYTFKEWIDQRQAEEDAGARPSEIDEAAKTIRGGENTYRTAHLGVVRCPNPTPGTSRACGIRF